jgi:trehalose 6-phosphate synthase/phosphatase
MKTQIEEFVGRLNGRFGTIHWTPIVYQYRSLPFSQLVALYSSSEIMLVTPLRDGMNLIAKEYVATRNDRTGVLILSEMAGAAKELGEAIIVNPNNVEEIADALSEALEMPRDEQIRRNEVMQTRLKRYNIVRWADDFIQSLLSVTEQQKIVEAKLLGTQFKRRMLQDFENANSRLLLLDYDGTLVGFTGNPQLAKPDTELLTMLAQLGTSPGTDLVIVSGRDKGTLQRWFDGLNVSLVAEHGVWIKEVQSDWKLMKRLNNNWKPHLLSILSQYVDRLPRSFIEEKDYSIGFHYREADPDQASVRITELMDNLLHFIGHTDLRVLQGNKVLEIRNTTINKGTASQHFLSRKKYDFVLSIGDDWTDEDMFAVLPVMAFTIKIGITRSNAQRYLRTQADALTLIREFASTASKMILLMAGLCNA